MDTDIRLTITYGDLRDLLNAMQDDGLNADGCIYGLHLDAEEEIDWYIRNGTIKVGIE